MRFIYCFLLAFLLVKPNLHSQTKPFQNKIGYFEYDLTPWLQVVDSSGNHYVVGQFLGTHTVSEMTIETRGDRDVYVIKYDSANNFQWIRSYGSPGQDYPRSVSCDRDGNIYITGQYMGSPFYASNTMTLNAITQYQQSRFLIKINSNGATQWAKRFSGTSNTQDQRGEVINDHEGRLYLIHSNRANGALSSWNYNDSIIANPSNQFINVPRWAMARIDQNTGNLKWVNYIANPNVSASTVVILNISRPVIDSKNNILFAVSHYGSHINPIYVFGQYAAVNPNANNILVKIDSMGAVKRFRDLGASNSSRSDAAELALNANDEPVLIHKKALINTDGFYRDYWSKSTFNFARIYDTSFVLKQIVKLGTQAIGSFAFDKENRLVTLNTISVSQNGSVGGVESVNVDSVSTAGFTMRSMSETFFVRYKANFALDTVYSDSNILPYGALYFLPNALTVSSKGDLLILTSNGIMNNAVFRYTKKFVPKNTNYGKLRDIPESIQNIGEDSTKAVYVGGFMHLRADFGTASGTYTFNNPIERGADIFIAKYKTDNTLAWIRRIGKSGNESPNFFKVGKDGLYITANSQSTEQWQFDTTNVYFPGKQVVIKVDFNGNLVWTKEIVTTGTNSVTISGLNILRNGKILLSGSINGAATISGQAVTSIGNRGSILLAVLDNGTGQLVTHNKYALANENLGALGSFTSSFHEDNNGGIYYGLLMNTNTTATNTSTEIYSARTSRIPFRQLWLNQHGLIKVDSTLEIKKFKTFPSYLSVGHIGGLDSTILFTAYARGSSFDYDTIGGVRTIPLHNYASNAHFTHFTGKIDRDLNIVELTKYDTTSIENNIELNSRRIIPDVFRNEMYESISFSNNLKLDSTENVINAIGSRDIMFLKYDRNGKLMGGERLGTPQTDFFIAAAASSSGLVFSTQSVNPVYQTQYLKMKNVYEIRQSVAEKPINVSGDAIKTFSTNSTVAANLDILSPDNYISRNLSLYEVGRTPDTTIVKTGVLNLCRGGTSYLTVNTATSIRWKKDGVLLAGQSDDSLAVSTTGYYKAILTTAEGRVDSTRAVLINFYEPPAAPSVTAQSVCIGEAATSLNVSTVAGNSLRWYGTSATGGTASTTAPTPSSSTAGTTNYYVSQISAQGCESDRALVAFTVNPKPAAPLVSPISTCVGTLTPLTASASSGNSLRWYGLSATGGTPTATAPTPFYIVTGSANYYVSQISAQGCESDRAIISYTVNPLPTKPVINWNGSEMVIAQSYTSYQWLLNNTVITGASAIQYKPINPGSYRALVRNTAGCADTSASIELLVTALSGLNIAGNKVNIYPNPATESTTLDLGKKPYKPVTVNVLTAEGRLVQTFQFKDQVSVMPIGNLNNGVYFITVLNGKEYYQFKLIKH